MHTLTPAQVRELTAKAEGQHLGADARERLEWLVHFFENGCSVTETCTAKNISRSTFHRWLERFDPNDLSTLQEKSHEPRTPRTHIVPDHIITLIRAYRQTHPLMGKETIRELLASEHQIDVSSSTVGRVIERECLYFAQTPLHWRKRMEREEEKRVQPEQKLETIAPIVLRAAAMVAEQNTHTHSADHDCMLCSMKRMGWSRWKRALVVGSVLANIAIGALFAATATWESKSITAQVSTTTHNDTPSISSSLDQ